MDVVIVTALLVIIAFEGFYIFYQGEGHRAERAELLDRIMAADWQTYRNTQDQTPPPPGGSFLRQYRQEMSERFGRIDQGGDA